jgi:hypothetical protein
MERRLSELRHVREFMSNPKKHDSGGWLVQVNAGRRSGFDRQQAWVAFRITTKDGPDLPEGRFG